MFDDWFIQMVHFMAIGVRYEFEEKGIILFNCSLEN